MWLFSPYGTATITEVKNGLSAILDRVKAGESVVVTDRGVPVAVIEPVTGHVDLEDRLAAAGTGGDYPARDGQVPPELIRTPGPTP